MENLMNQIDSAIQNGELTLIEENLKLNMQKFLTNYGTYNTLPEPFRLIEDEDEAMEVLSRLVTYGVWGIEYRQVVYQDKFYSLKIFWLWNGGVGISTDYRDGKWKIKVWKFGCEHKNVTEEKIAPFYYRVVCLDCGLEWKYDSSG